MAIWLTENSKIIVQGMTGSEGTKHTRRMLAAGSRVVGGVNARKAGTTHEGLPVFGTVKEAMEKTRADVSVVFVPRRSPRTPSRRPSTPRSRSAW
ncbi:hypothetical protein ACFSTC_50810 [Nonomuraea ferruginea]